MLISGKHLKYDNYYIKYEDTMISNMQSVQYWLKQFSKTHRIIAESLLNSLVYIKSSSLIMDLKEAILENENKEIVSILPIRELEKNEQIFDLTDKTIPPKLQTSNQPLGSEAFISNLYTQLNRKNKINFPLSNIKMGRKSIIISNSLDEMQKLSIKKLILVDDLIGSGDRTKIYLETLYNHPTIKSWLSFGTLNIEVLAYMSTLQGENVVKKYIKNKKGINLNILYSAPTIYDLVNFSDIKELCEAYCDKREKNPLGYGNSAVRVIFSHSAPNNIPTILYRSKNKYRSKIEGITKLNKWDALFPSRYVNSDYIYEIESKMKSLSKINKIKLIINNLSANSLHIKKLSRILNLPQYEIRFILKNLEKMGWVNSNNGVYTLTELGNIEVGIQSKGLKFIATNPEFYYPRKW
ncbi:phosphoribosyltransferase-like protein [Proteus penneri]|uniref:phosphoribosyltransferase-like protein n=1 Tax=Proteus TaxID=583 RepID=UPI001377DD9E|nr:MULTISPECIES: hypothetical protein [Proteus]NBM91540.1 hypothetical protein [Proteus sp. G2658]